MFLLVFPTTISTLLASGCTAKLLSSFLSSGLMVSKHALSEKKTNTKRQCQSTSTDLNQRPREKVRASIWTGAQPNLARRRNRYTASKLSARPIHSSYNIQLDWTPSRRTQKINLPTNQKGYDNSETTVGKLSARRIQICRIYFCLGIILKVILNNFQNNA